MKNSLYKLLGNVREQQAKKKRAIRCLLGFTKPKEDEPPPVKVKKPRIKVLRPRPRKKRVPSFFNIPPVWPPKEYKSPFESGYAFSHFLEKKGWKRLGSGAFSRVYAKEGSDRVLKVTSREDNWIDYIQWAAKKGYCGTFAPRVYSYKKIKGTQLPFAVSVVERFEETASSIPAENDFAFLDTLLGYHKRGNTMASLFMEELAPGITKFETDLRQEFAKKDKSRLDYHGGNFMVRKDGSFCFTDPVCGERTTKSTRLKASDFTSLANAIGEYFDKINRVAILSKISQTLDEKRY